MTTTPDTIDPATVPTELRQLWSKRSAAKLAASAGVFCQTREGVVQWSLRGKRVVVWRKRGRLHVNAGTGTAVALTSRAGMLLETWGMLEAIVSQLVPAIPCKCGGPAALVSYGDRGGRGSQRRICPKCSGTASNPASEFTDAEADACSRIFGGGL